MALPQSKNSYRPGQVQRRATYNLKDLKDLKDLEPGSLEPQ